MGSNDTIDARDGAHTEEGSTMTALTEIAPEAATIPQARQSADGETMSAAVQAMTTVTMIEPMAGFDADLDFSLQPIDEAGMLQSLRSTRDPELRFVLSPAEVFFAPYRDSLEPVIAAPVADALGIEPTDAQLQLYVMLTIGESLADTTANLRAPIVVDQVTGRAVQIIVDDDSLPLREPLPTEQAAH